MFRCGRAGAEALLTIFFCAKSFVHPTLSVRAEGVVRGLSVRELRTQK